MVVIHAGTPVLVGFPGEPIGGVAAAIAKISSLNLGPDQGSIVAPPALLPDGKVIFFAQINGGSAQMILRADPVAQTLTTLVTLGGAGASATPAGGTYDSATSAPAVDDRRRHHLQREHRRRNDERGADLGSAYRRPPGHPHRRRRSGARRAASSAGRPSSRRS